MRFPLGCTESFSLPACLASRWCCSSNGTRGGGNCRSGWAATPFDGRGTLQGLDGSLKSIAFRDQKRNNVFGLH
jgi:hypothetical protein